MPARVFGGGESCWVHASDSAPCAGRCVRLGVRAVTGRYSRAAKSELERSASPGGEKGCC